MADAVVGHSPALLRAMVAVVADALASVEVGADGVGTGAAADAAVLLRHILIGVVHQGVADVIDVHIVGFAEVALTGAFVGTDTNALVDPSDVAFHVALIIQHFLDVGVDVGHALHRETAREDFEVVVVAFELAEPVVAAAAAHRVRCDVGIVANEEDIDQVTLRISVDAVDVVLDLVLVVATNLGEAHDRGGTARLVLPIDERLHGFHILVGANDQHLAAVLKEIVLGIAFLVVDKAVAVGLLHLGGDLLGGFATHFLVHAVVAHLLHGDGHVMIDAQGLRHGIVGEGAHHDVLATVVADDVRRFKVSLCCRIESVLVVHRTIGVRHALRVDLTAEVALRRGDFYIRIVRKFALDHADRHLGHVADDGRDRELGKVGGTGFKHRGHFRDRYDLLCAARSVHPGQVETAKREVDNDLLLAARDQSDLGANRSIAADGIPLLGKCHH